MFLLNPVIAVSAGCHDADGLRRRKGSLTMRTAPHAGQTRQLGRQRPAWPHRVGSPSGSLAGREAACLAVFGPSSGRCSSLAPRIPHSHAVRGRLGVGRPAEAPIQKNRPYQAGTCGPQRWHSCSNVSLLPTAAVSSVGRA